MDRLIRSTLLVLSLLLASVLCLSAQCPPGALIGPAVDVPLPAEARCFSKGDFNEDGMLDLATAAGVTGTSNGQLSVLLGTGGGSFGAAMSYPLSLLPEAMAVGDFDDDGIDDLVLVGGGGGNGAVATMLGAGQGGIGTGAFVPGPTLSVPPIYPSTTQGDLGAVVVGDFNEDGISDIAAPASFEPFVRVLFGNGTNGLGDGSFVVPATPAVSGGGDADIAAADFNEDGVLDLAVLQAGARRVQILWGLGPQGIGSGMYQLGPFYAIPGLGVPNSLRVGDFDQDGIFDLAVSHVNTQVFTLQGQGAAGIGDGTFGAPVPYSAGSAPWGLAGGDFNNDGFPDIAVARHASIYSGAGNFSLLLGTATGTFVPHTTYITTPGFPKDVLVDDFNGDGIADFVLTKSAPHVTFVPGLCAQSPQQLAVTAPSGSPTWPAGTNQQISWTKSPGVLLVDVDVSRDGGFNWKPVARGLTDSSFTWSVPYPASPRALIRVRDANLSSRSATSPPFQIMGSVAASTPIGPGCGATPTSLSATAPSFGQPLTLSLSGPASASGLLVGGDPLAPPLVVGGCDIYLDLAGPLATVPLTTDAAGAWTITTGPVPYFVVPSGTATTLQAVVLAPGSGLGFTLSNGVDLIFGL